MNLVNGKPKSSISIFDRGFLYGDGVFETILVLNKDPKNRENPSAVIMAKTALNVM